MVKHLPAMPGFDPWVGKIPWRRKWQSTPVLLPGKSHGWRSLVGSSPWGRKESDMTEWLHFICKIGEGNGSTLAWKIPWAYKAAVHGVAKSWTRLSNFTFTFYYLYEIKWNQVAFRDKWRIPGTAGPGGLPSMGSHRVGHNWSDLAAAAANVL